MPNKKPIIMRGGTPLRGAQSPEELKLLDYHALCCKWAHRYKRSFDSFEDAYQIAFVGLIKAREKWIPKRGPFGAIAPFYVKDAIVEELDRRQRQNGLALPERTRGKYLARRGHKFKDGSTGFKLVRAETIRPDGTTVDLLEQIADDAPNAEDMLGERQEAAALKQRIEEALGHLDPRERRVLDVRIMGEENAPRSGRGKGRTASLEALAQELGVSRERVRQLEVKALAKLRAFLEGGTLPPPKKPTGRPPRHSGPKPPPQPVVMPDIPAEARQTKASIIRWLMGQPRGVTGPEAAEACAALFPGTGRAIIAGRLTLGVVKAREPSRGVVYRLAQNERAAP